MKETKPSKPLLTIPKGLVMNNSFLFGPSRIGETMCFGIIVQDTYYDAYRRDSIFYENEKDRSYDFSLIGQNPHLKVVPRYEWPDFIKTLFHENKYNLT